MANLTTQKAQPHPVLRRIKYRSGLEGQRYIDPGTEEVPFDHLDDVGYQLLLKKKIIGLPGSAKPAAPKAEEKTSKK